MGSNFVSQVLVPLSLVAEFDQAHQLAVIPGANPNQIIVDLRRFGEDALDIKDQIASGGDNEGDFALWI